jgi:hypothetical protein
LCNILSFIFNLGLDFCTIIAYNNICKEQIKPLKKKGLEIMKLVINGTYGGYGFGVADEFEALVEKYEDERTALELIAFVEEHPDDCGDLEVVEIPDEATDYLINEYDGAETVYYVVDGKIHLA